MPRFFNTAGPCLLDRLFVVASLTASLLSCGCQEGEVCLSACEDRDCGPDGCGGSCGTCTAHPNSYCDDFGRCACGPDTCSSLSAGCGEHDDGCGESLNCGACNDFPNSTCDDGECRCTPDTCETLGKACGEWSDGCGAILDCGGCPCEPETCETLGKECGEWDDGCGTSLSCGDCLQGYCDNGVCRVGVDCGDESILGPNLVSDPGFESNDGSWSFGGGDTRVSTDSHQGSWSARSVANLGSNIRQSDIPVSGGSYRLSMYLKSNTPGDPSGNAFVHVRLYDASSTQIVDANIGYRWSPWTSGSGYYHCPTAQDHWSKWAESVVVPADAARMTLYLSWRAGTDPGTYTLFDSVCLCAVTSPVGGTGGRRRIYWWLGNGLGQMSMSRADRVTGFSIHYEGPWRPDYEAQNGYRLVGDYGDMDHDDSTNDVVATIEALQDNYTQGARKLSTDLEWGHFDHSETRQLIDAVEGMPGLEVLQWQGSGNWDLIERDMLEQCDRIILAEMIYPLGRDRDRTYQEVYDKIYFDMSHYTYKPEDRHATGLSTIYYGPDNDQNVVLSWDEMQMQIDAAIAYGNSIGHPNQAIAFYYPVSAEYADQIVTYIDE